MIGSPIDPPARLLRDVEDLSYIADATRDSLGVQVLQQRYRVLPRHSRQLLECPDVDLPGRPGVLTQLRPQILQGLPGKIPPVGETDQISTANQQVDDPMEDPSIDWGDAVREVKLEPEALSQIKPAR